MDFFETVVTRRSVRRFTTEPVADGVIDRALDAALLAPNSSNMQTWEFYWVKDPTKKQALVTACLKQAAARTAPELVVAVASPSHWPRQARAMRERVKAADGPEQVLKYYDKLMPLVYGLQLFAPFKWVAMNVAGLFRPTPRTPWSLQGRAEVCIKSCALACENFMLAITAQGYDSCPMEGFDEVRVKSLLGLPYTARVVMVMSAGKRSPGGIWGERIRLPREWAVKIV